MRLSTIKLAGFKSFVEPTKIPFPDQMTCVVGPNGCGKSNVIDAVRWVLGESSAKNLRGDAMTDVIFNGSTTRKAISQASVELIFDNTAGHLPNTFADRNQVSIKRLVTRDGQSFYYLNGSKCRKRDITDIFLGTGLGPRSYAIIEQGMISRLIESKPQELRVFLEEAAGVSKYKERRRETQTRIKSTRENLERLLDVRKELQAQRDKLAVQSIEAKKYREFKAQERTLKGQIAVLKWQDLHQQQVEKKQQITQLAEQIDFLETAHAGHDDVLASLETHLQVQQDKLSDAQQQQHITHTELTRAEQQQISLKQQQQALQQSITKLSQQQSSVTQQQAEQQSQCEQLAETLENACQDAALAEQQVIELKETFSQCSSEKQQHDSDFENYYAQQITLDSQLQSQHSQVASTEQAIAHVTEQQQQLTSQIDELLGQEIEQQRADLQSEQQTTTQKLAQVQTQLTQLQGTVGEYKEQLQQQELKVQQLTQQCNEHKASIAGLNSSIGWLDNNDKQSNLLAQLQVEAGFETIVEQALSWLSQLTLSSSAAQNSVWPNQAEKHTQLNPHSVANKVISGVYPDFLRHIAYQHDAAPDMLLAQSDFIAVINNKGELFGTNWQLTSNTNEENSLLLKHQQLHQKNQQLAEQDQQLQQAQNSLLDMQQQYAGYVLEQEQLKSDIHQLTQTLAVNTSRHDMLSQQLSKQQQQVKDLTLQQATYTEQLATLHSVLQQQQQQCTQLEQQQDEITQQVNAAQLKQRASTVQYEQLSQQLEHYKSAAHAANLAEQNARSAWQLGQTKLAHVRKECESAQHTTADLQQQLADLELPAQELAEKVAMYLAQHHDAQQQLQLLQDDLRQAKLQLNEKQQSLKHSQGELLTQQAKLQKLTLAEQGLLIKAQAALEPLAELQQNVQQVLATLPESAHLAQLNTKLTEVSQQLAALGAVNLAAIAEFEQAKQRSEYLDHQLEDLSKALTTLEGAINKIDKETKTRFKATFDQVNSDFASLFPKVFGGGSAYLELTSDDLLESGVSIMARPPGKKNSTIHLLSGGEKALSALSLVFSIFRLNPAPFCMLDEVDAPLDDANVVRFCRLVEEMSQSVQFIYISHNKIAMEMAARLTGVTMAEPGVSRVVAVDIEQAVQLAQS